MRLSHIIPAIALLAVTGGSITSCDTNQPLGRTQSSTASVTSNSTISQPPVDQLQENLTTAKAAVNAGDFIAARQKFHAAESHWQIVQEMVKAQSHNQYKAIASNLKEANRSLYSAPLSREKTVLSLRALEQKIEQVAAASPQQSRSRLARAK